MNTNARGRSGSWQQRWPDPAITVLAIELAVAIFIIVPLGVLAPRSGLVLPLLLTALVLAPVLLAAVLVASDNGAARAARGLSNLEAVMGQLFPATVIARMVTLHLTGRHRGEAPR